MLDPREDMMLDPREDMMLDYCKHVMLGIWKQMVVLGDWEHIVVDHWERNRDHGVAQQGQGIVLGKRQHIVVEQRDCMDFDHSETTVEHQRPGKSFGCWKECSPLFDVRDY